MMYRVRKCADGRWYVQRKQAPGLAGGIWYAAAGDDGHPTRESAETELEEIRRIVSP